MHIPDVTGYPLNKARCILTEAGIVGIDIRITTPPRQKGILPDESARVVRQTISEDGKTAGLVVCVHD
ncbi:MAG: hypothetical protein HGA22_13520 [Clostridiales bacterium]|nr:hypothetical protein [Clostridiales bacterium]